MDHRTMILDEDSKFNFHCHHGLDCFKKCCRDINIYLSPYDVLRMKNHLGLSSQDFLDKYTLIVPVDDPGLPLVQIKMCEENELVCPFITPKGCGVYQNRPWACRIAPVDLLGRGKYSFIFESTRCHGLNEEKTQTVKEWMADQGLEIYDQIEQGFSQIPFHLKMTGDKQVDQQLIKLFFMACYNLDQFRSFLSANSGLAGEFGLSRQALEQSDDVQLMKFSFALLNQGTEALRKVCQLI